MTDNKILPVSQNVKWIGALDPDLRTFDIVMETKYGTTYNSYLITAQKKAIVETVKLKFWDVFYSKLISLTDPKEIEYIIVDHTEPDHSGSIKKLLEIAPNAKVAGSGNAIRYLEDIIGVPFNSVIVKDGDTIDLGNMKLRVIGAPNLHWPDSIYTYLEEEKILFTCDSFGAHFCHPEMYDNLAGNYDDAFKYYYDVILKPFHKFMLKAIDKIRNLEINAVCTGHGPLLTHDWKKYIDLSEKFSLEAGNTCKSQRVYMPYVSAYDFTGELAEKIAEGIKQAGNIEVIVSDIEKVSASEIDENIASCSAIMIGSPTINQNALPQIYQIFALINPLRDRNKLAAAFGSYGWSGEGVKIIEGALRNLKLDVFDKNMAVKFKPHEKDFLQYIEFGKSFGLKLIEKSNN